jgi:N-acetylmuramoyl-L-alanine amidase
MIFPRSNNKKIRGKMRKINKIIIHCSDSSWGDAAAIDSWHKENGWDGIGYHYVITNGNRRPGDKYSKKDDGIIEKGRNIEKAGAHCKGHNKDSIGICLIGIAHFTAKQLCEALPSLLLELMKKHKITADCVYTHHEFDSRKTCPNITPDILFSIAETQAQKIFYDEKIIGNII